MCIILWCILMWSQQDSLKNRRKNRAMKDNSKAFSMRNLEQEIVYILWRIIIFPWVKTNLVGREALSYISVNLFTMWIKREVDFPIYIQSILIACHLGTLKHSETEIIWRCIDMMDFPRVSWGYLNFQNCCGTPWINV